MLKQKQKQSQYLGTINCTNVLTLTGFAKKTSEWAMGTPSLISLWPLEIMIIIFGILCLTRSESCVNITQFMYLEGTIERKSCCQIIEKSLTYFERT